MKGTGHRMGLLEPGSVMEPRLETILEGFNFKFSFNLENSLLMPQDYSQTMTIGQGQGQESTLKDLESTSRHQLGSDLRN